MMNKFILELNQVGIDEVETAGDRYYSLGALIPALSSMGINISNGLVVTVAAYGKFFKYIKLDRTVSHIIYLTDNILLRPYSIIKTIKDIASFEQ